MRFPIFENHLAHKLAWRPCAGIALFNDAGKVFCGKRRPDNLPPDAPLWQLPQGGIDAGEAPRDAAFRELAEETGIASAQLTVMNCPIGCAMICRKI